MTWKKELLSVCRDLRQKVGTALPGHHPSASQQIEGTPFTVMVTFQGMRPVARGQYFKPSYSFTLIAKGIVHMSCDAQDGFIEAAARKIEHTMQPERESQSSKHCDSGWMNDVRFGDQS